MAEAVTNELMYELLKRMNADIAGLKDGQARIEARLSTIDGHLIEFFRQAKRQDDELIEVRTRLTRIERRLDIVD